MLVVVSPTTEEVVEEVMGRLAAVRDEIDLVMRQLEKPPGCVGVNEKYTTEWYNPYCKYRKVWS